jgi:hypothetical protein
VDETFEEFFHS